LVGTIHGLRPDVKLVVMGPDADDEVILQAISAGAKAYLEASASPQQVEQAIMIVSQGSIWAPRRVLSIFVDRATKPSRSAVPSSAQFTARETEVLKLLVAARSNREIARTLGIEERTVKAHVAKLMRKVGVENRIALSIYAVTNSIVAPNPE
jgi:DNA-binding NarL/FixJ family response regulator